MAKADSQPAKLAITNAHIYKAIAMEAHAAMHELMKSGRRPKDNGSPGWINLANPQQKSFKQAMIAIVFTAIWLEAFLHLLIGRDRGLEKAEEYDFKSYKKKLELLGCSEPAIIEAAERLQMCRKELVHEKAYFDTGQVKTAQDEADNANRLLLAVDARFQGPPRRS